MQNQPERIHLVRAKIKLAKIYVSTVIYSDFCKDSLFDLQRPVS